ncbi:hypothetical protein [Halapricum desulfuricans]|nr:hypothetical protein [Halapricum desulfuricans]
MTAFPLEEAITVNGGSAILQAGMFDPIGDIIIDALQSVLKVLFTPIKKIIQDSASAVVNLILETPHPNEIFGPPSNGVWPDLYVYYWDSLIPLVLFLYGATIMLVIFLQATSHLFGSYHRAKLIKRSFTGLMGILAWWWIAGLSLRFANSLTALLAPDLSSITLFETLSFGAMGVLGLVITLSVDLVLFGLLALLYFSRQVVLYLFVIAMPILIVFWIPGVGPMTLLSNFARRLAGFYVPFLFMTLPVALLFRLADILGNSFGLSAEGITAWLLALVIPFVAVLAPIIFIWQAGAIFFIGRQTASHTSRRQAANRAQTMRSGGQTTTHAGQNFSRGLQGQPAMTPDGQYVFDSGDSRAHAAGARVNSLGSRVQRVVDERRGNPPGPPSGGAPATPALPKPRATEEPVSRHGEFETLRGRTSRGSERTPPPRESDDTDQRSTE